jgi:hypothetical protein
LVIGIFHLNVPMLKVQIFMKWKYGWLNKRTNKQTNERTNERMNKRTNGFKVFKVEILQHFSFAYESSIAHISSPKMGVQFIKWNLQIHFIFCNFKNILKLFDPTCKVPQNKKVGSKVNYLQTRFCNINLICNRRS